MSGSPERRRPAVAQQRQRRIRKALKDVTSGRQDTEARGTPSNVPPAPRKQASKTG